MGEKPTAEDVLKAQAAAAGIPPNQAAALMQLSSAVFQLIGARVALDFVDRYLMQFACADCEGRGVLSAVRAGKSVPCAACGSLGWLIPRGMREQLQRMEEEARPMCGQSGGNETLTWTCQRLPDHEPPHRATVNGQVEEWEEIEGD